jgi:TP901 family phage tail tape measure protein
MGLLNPVIATLFADTKEYMAKMSEAEEKMGKFGLAAEASSSKFSKFASKASTAVIGLGGAIAGYAVDEALKFNEVLDKIQNQSGASAAEVDSLKKSILNISSQTAISSDNIGNAFLQVEKAGYRGKAAYDLVNAAAKASAITGGDVVSTTQSVVAIQRLQIARGMSVAAISDLLVQANKSHVGSLEQLTGVLSGKVGGALAAAGLNLAEMASVSSVASQAGFGTAKAYTSLATGLEKVENPTSAYAKNLKGLGLNAETLAATARKPGTGLVDVLKMLETQSRKTGIPMNTLIKDTFGPASIGLVSTLAKNLNQVADANKNLQSASGSKLDLTFGLTSEQLNFKLKKLETESKNALTGFGLALLPTVDTLTNWTNNAVTYFNKHPLVQKIASDTALTLFGASLAFKVTQAIGKIPGLGTVLGKIPVLGNLFKSTDTALLTEIAANTAATAVETTVIANKPTSITKGGLGDVVASVGAAIAIDQYIGVPLRAWIKTQFQAPADGVGMPNNAATQALGGFIAVQNVTPNGMGVTGPVMQILQAQQDVINKLYEAHKITIAQANKATQNFAKQDLQRNYSLKVKIS